MMISIKLNQAAALRVGLPAHTYCSYDHYFREQMQRIKENGDKRREHGAKTQP